METIILSSYNDINNHLNKIRDFIESNNIRSYWITDRLLEIQTRISNGRSFDTMEIYFTSLINEIINVKYNNLVKTDEKFQKLQKEFRDLRVKNINLMKKNSKTIKKNILEFLAKYHISNANDIIINISYNTRFHYYNSFTMQFSYYSHHVSFRINNQGAVLVSPSFSINADVENNGILDMFGLYFSNKKFKTELTSILISLYNEYYSIADKYNESAFQSKFRTNFLNQHQDLFNFKLMQV